MIYTKGIALIVAATISFVVSYRFYRNNVIDKALFFIVLGGLILRGWCMSDGFLHEWDERYHALVAKHLADNPFVPLLFKTPVLPYDFRQWTLSHVWLHKQPMALWLMAGSIKLFGMTEFAVRLPSLILSLIGIYLTFHIATFFSNTKTGLLAAFFQSINGLVIEIATGREATDHIDNTFFFFIELAIFWILLFLRKKNLLNLVLIGVWVGCALLSKYLPALIVLPIFILLTYDTEGGKKTVFNTMIITFVASVVALPWQIYIFQTFPNEANWESHFNFLHLTHVVEGHDGTFLTHFYWATRIWNELIYVVMAWFIFLMYKNRFDKKLWALAVWIGLPYLFFSSVATKMVAYPLFIAPAIFTLVAMFWWYFKDKIWIVSWLNQLILISIIVLAIRYSYERIKPFDPKLEETQTATIVKNWKTQLPTDGKAVIFNTPFYIEAMFYNNITAAYPYLPTSGQINDLIGKGYKIVIIRNQNISNEILYRNDIEFL